MYQYRIHTQFVKQWERILDLLETQIKERIKDIRGQKGLLVSQILDDINIEDTWKSFAEQAMKATFKTRQKEKLKTMYRYYKLVIAGIWIKEKMDETATPLADTYASVDGQNGLWITTRTIQAEKLFEKISTEHVPLKRCLKLDANQTKCLAKMLFAQRPHLRAKAKLICPRN